MKMAAALKIPPQINNARQVSEVSKSSLRRKSDFHRRIEEDILMASRVGDTAWLERSLKTATLPLDFTDDDGLSAIHLAALDCQLECLKILIEKMSLDVNHKTPDGWTCLHLVINNLMPERSLACVDYLLSCGADPSSVTDSGITPMHQAAACGNVPCLQSLIDSGGVIDYEDERGHTPCSLATLWGHRMSVRILKHHQWQKDKKSEDVVKKQILMDQIENARRERERKKKEKIEKRLRGQKAYQLWLGKNHLGNMPLLFGQHLLLDDDAERIRADSSREKMGSSRAMKAKRSTTSREQYQERLIEASKQVSFMPIAGSGSPTTGRRHQADYNKRSSNLNSGRIKAIQKRGTLQFPVI